MDRGLSILVVNHASGAEIGPTLEWILATVRRRAEVLVVDDGSTDGSREGLRKVKGIRLLETDREGIPQALNAGFELAGTNDVITVHPGVTAGDAGWLDRLLRAGHETPRAGIVGAKAVLADGRILSAGRMPVSARGIRDHHADLGRGEMDRGEANRGGRAPSPPAPPRRVDTVRGLLTWYRREAIEAAGGADPGFSPLWWEDDDLCIAARAAGFEIYVEPTVRAVVSSMPYERAYTPEMKQQALEEHARHWEAKWGWHPEYPDLHAIRARWGGTAIAWRIGAALRDEWPAGESPDGPDVDALIVTWNNRAGLESCLASVAGTRYPRLRFTVLDNGSTDGTAEFLANLRARVASGGPGPFPFPLEVISTPVNIGLPAGMNWLVKCTRAPLVARLDDDVILEPDWLTRMVADLREHPYAGCVGGKLNHRDRPTVVQCADYRFWPRMTGHEEEPDTGRHDRLLLANHVRGCALLYRRKALDVAGPFDIRYSPSQWDDPDHHIALRAAGYDVLYDGRIRILHPLTNGADRSPKAVANSQGNLHKLQGKWGGDIFEVLDRGLDLAGRRNTHAEASARAAPEPSESPEPLAAPAAR